MTTETAPTPRGMPATSAVDGEDWAPVRSFEGLYEVSSAGSVRRVGRAARSGMGRGGGAVIGRVLKPQITRFGYHAIMLWRDGKPTRRFIHVLVAEAFLPKPAGNVEVNHISGIKTENGVANLEWVSRSENAKHAYRTGLRLPSVPSGSSHHNAKLSDEQVIAIRTEFRRGLGPTLAARYGVDHSTIYRIVKGAGRLTAGL